MTTKKTGKTTKKTGKTTKKTGKTTKKTGKTTAKGAKKSQSKWVEFRFGCQARKPLDGNRSFCRVMSTACTKGSEQGCPLWRAVNFK